MTRHRTALALVACAALAVAALPAVATEQLAKSTSLSCTACHDKPGSRLLTDQGKYYELMRTLDGYESLQTSFGRCTYCHVRKPGTAKLTREGKRFAALVDDMKGLKEWLEKGHPKKRTRSDSP